MAVFNRYDGYSVEFLSSMAIRYVEGDIVLDFEFDPGNGQNMVLFTKPKNWNDTLSNDDLNRAVERVVAHLRSIGYDVMTWGG